MREEGGERREERGGRRKKGGERREEGGMRKETGENNGWNATVTKENGEGSWDRRRGGRRAYLGVLPQPWW